MTPKIAAAFGITFSEWDPETRGDARPTDLFPVIRDYQGKREAVPMRWGLIPHWAHGVALKASTFNATVERVETAPTYRTAWRKGQRCIVPVSSFYEPHLDDRRAKITFRITLKGRKWFGLAGLWDESVSSSGEIITSCTLVTMPASPKMAEVHDEKKRQPVMLREEDHVVWL